MIIDNALWWQDEPELVGKRHIYMIAHVKALDDAQFESRQEDLENGHAYDPSCTLMGTELQLTSSPDTEQPIENVIRSGVDTMTAHLTRDRPRLAVLTDDAGYELQEQAKGIEKVLEAEFRRLKVHHQRYLQRRDSGVWGSGLVKFYELEDKPALDRTIKDEIVVDEEEGRFYSPRSIYQRRFFDRYVMIHRYARGPKAKEIREAIEKANANGRWCTYRKVGRNQVAVVEGWHLASGEGATDGRRTVCIEGYDLVDVPWKRPYFPFLKLDYSPGLTRFWGSGIAEQGRPIQGRIDRHDHFISVAQDKIAIPRVYFQKGSGIDVHLDNRVGAKVGYTGRPPVFETPQAVSPEIYQDRREKKNTFFEALGIDQLSASAKMPARMGADSAPAIREYRDGASERHAPQEQADEDMLVEYGERILDIIEDIAARTGTYKTTYLSQDTREEVDWDTVKLARDRYSLVVVAANGLSRTMAGHRAEVEEDYAAGVITLDEYRKLRGLPDVSAERALEGAVTSLADSVIGGLIRGAPASETAPDPLDDLEFIVRRVKLKRAHLKAHKAPDDMLERFDTWIEQCEFLTGLASQGAAPPAAPAVPPEALAQAGPPMLENAAPPDQVALSQPPPV